MNQRPEDFDSIEEDEDYLLPIEALIAWGDDDIAYIRRTVEDEKEVWAIHNAQGERLGLAKEKSSAVAYVLDNEMEPYVVH